MEGSYSLSRAGREIMIKYVLQSILTYVMRCFELSTNMCDKIESLLCDFYYDRVDGRGKIH